MRLMILALITVVASAYSFQVVTDRGLSVGNLYNAIGYLPPGWYSYRFFNVSSGFWLDVVADRHVQVLVFSNSTFSKEGLKAKPLWSAYGINVSSWIPLGRGRYVVVVNNNGTSPVVFRLAINRSAPIGVSDYGVVFTNPPVVYNYTTREFRLRVVWLGGEAASPRGDAYSIQLNVYAEVNTSKGIHYYWLQNVIQFYNGKFRILNNIWNHTDAFSYLSKEVIKGLGNVGNDRNPQGVLEDYYYKIAFDFKDAAPPINTSLYIKVGVRSDGRPWFAFGYDVGRGVEWYDNVTLNLAARSVAIAVRGLKKNPRGLELNAEGVVGGMCCREHADFKKISVVLQLEYWNGTHFAAVPSFVNFGQATAETASNIKVVALYGRGANLTRGVYLPEYMWSRYVPIYISDYDRRGWVVVFNGTFLNLTRPPLIDFGNRTRVRYLGNSLGVGGVVVTKPLEVVFRWQREYLVRVSGPVERSEWVPEGGVYEFSPPPVVDFGNATRLVFEGWRLGGVYRGSVSFVVRSPAEVVLLYRREYLITLVDVAGVSRYWVAAGSVFSPRVESIIDFGNGTRAVLKDLKLGNVSISSVVVNAPATIVVERGYQYFVTYRVYNESGGVWVERGGSAPLPRLAVLYLGNGTRLVPLGYNYSGPVYKPMHIVAEYRREYNITLHLYSRDGVYLGPHYVGWAPGPPRQVEWRGVAVRVEARSPPPEVEAVADVGHVELEVRDFLSMPAPFSEVSISCGNYTTKAVTDAAGRSRPLLPLNYKCEVSRPAVGVYSVAVLVGGGVLVGLLAVRRGR
ncbi:thermopsin family protease [Pyrobaculum ferrireducens]|uniref:Protease n=1 Tax=Pyrobaculum ferrireducens TaxID=1104324 RepID=G7VAZ9_9CREN|nr:thermopsin family protease [Pyrobaculum ferrireducens]AET32309.1 Protease [Pyrobaculum ferrireducens]